MYPRDGYDPFVTILEILRSLESYCKPYFTWRTDKFIDLLAGTDQIRLMLDAGRSTSDIVNYFKSDLDRFIAVRSKYLLY